MLVRPLDSSGDIVPIYTLDQMISGTNAVAQVINLRLHFYYGEWWEDEDMGFRVPDFLIGNARRGDVDLLSKYIASYVANTQDVRAVTDVATTYVGHKMTFYCAVITDEGENTSVEVNVSGIL